MSENKLERKQNTQIERTKITRTEFATMLGNNNIYEELKRLGNFSSVRITDPTSGDQVDLDLVLKESVTGGKQIDVSVVKTKESVTGGVESDPKLINNHVWRKMLDRKTQRMYYWNTKTKETQWERPNEMEQTPPLFNRKDYYDNYYYSKWVGCLNWDWFQTEIHNHYFGTESVHRNRPDYTKMINGLNCSFKCVNLNCEANYCKQWKDFYNHLISCDEYVFIRDKIKKCNGNIPMNARCKKCRTFCKWINNFERNQLLDDNQIVFFNTVIFKSNVNMKMTVLCREQLKGIIETLQNIRNNKYSERELEDLTYETLFKIGILEGDRQREYSKYISLLPDIQNPKYMSICVLKRSMIFIMNCFLFTIYFKKFQIPKSFFQAAIKEILDIRHICNIHNSNIIDHGEFYLDLLIGAYLKSFVKDYKVHSKIGKLMLKWYNDTKSKRLILKKKKIMKIETSMVCLQRITRGFIKRKLYRMKRSSIIRIQKIVRGYNARKKCKVIKANLEWFFSANAYAIIIQKLFRGFIIRKNKLLILAEITGDERYLDESISIIKRLEFQIKVIEKNVYNNMKFIANIKKNKSNTDPLYFFPKNFDYRFWNIHNGPYFSNPVISEIDAGDAFKIICPVHGTRDGDWFKIEYCKDCGYICDNLIAGKGIIGFVSIKDNPFERPESYIYESGEEVIKVMRNLTRKVDQYAYNPNNMFGRQYLFPHSTRQEIVHEISTNIKKTNKKINKLKQKLKDEKYKEENLRFIRKERKKREVQKQKLLSKKEEVEKTKEVRKIPEIKIEIKNSFRGNIKTKRGGEHRKWKEKRKSELSKITNISTGKKKVSPKKDLKMGIKKGIIGNLFKKKSISPKKRIKRKETMSGYVENKRSVLPKAYSKEERERQLMEYDKKEKLKYKKIFPDVIKYHLQLNHSLPEEAGGGYIYVDCHKKNMIDVRELIIEKVRENGGDYSFQGIILNIGSGTNLRPKIKNIYSKWDSLTEENYPILFEFKRRLKEIKRDINFTIKEVLCIKKEYTQLLYVGV